MAELVYVDEQPGEGHRVLLSAIVSKQFTEDQVVHVEPAADIDETIRLIRSHGCKVLITDYKLWEHNAEVNYSGAKLVEKFRQQYDRFPCFITTSFAGEAVNEPIDTALIFPKSDFIGKSKSKQEKKSDLPFFVRVRKKIDEYDAFVHGAMEEWRNLLKKKEDNGGLNAQDAQRLLELDNILEALHGKHVAVEGHLKSDDTLQLFEKLIDKTQVLIDRIENEIER